jgi:carbamate kinase
MRPDGVQGLRKEATVPRTAVVALGGNSFTRQDQTGSFTELAENAAVMARSILALHHAGWRVVVVHGNGPQVGNLAVQQDAGAAQVPAQPLGSLVAMTQGQLGSLIAMALSEAFCDAADVVTVVTHVEVDAADPAFDRPTKPIGPFYSVERAAQLRADRGWSTVEDAGRGHRRVVPSPRPRTVVEARAIRELVDRGHVVVAAGGGGVPFCRNGSRVRLLEAVIDKDLTAALVARSVEATSLVLVTGVDTVMVDYGTARQRAITLAGSDEMRAHLAAGQFPEGSMGPKVRACLDFVENGGRCAVITSPSLVGTALTTGRGAGTRIVSSAAGRGAA